MAEDNSTQVVEITTEQMSQLIVDGIISREIVKVGSPDEVELDINMNYKAEKTDDGKIVLKGCSIEITQKPKPQFVDTSIII